jgi:hypothetical protein
MIPLVTTSFPLRKQARHDWVSKPMLLGAFVDGGGLGIFIYLASTEFQTQGLTLANQTLYYQAPNPPFKLCTTAKYVEMLL